MKQLSVKNNRLADKSAMGAVNRPLLFAAYSFVKRPSGQEMLQDIPTYDMILLKRTLQSG